MSTQINVFGGTFRYEFLMQVRRRSLWITMLLVGLLEIALYARWPNTNFFTDSYLQLPITQTMAELAALINFLLPAAFGCMIADRLPRDRRTKVDELFTAMPGALSARLVGKYLGSISATLLPMLFFFLLGTGFILYRTGNIQSILLALPVFSIIILPGILFISAFSLACPSIMWVPLYQFCFVGYWFWGNFLSPTNGIPTISDTILTPEGRFMITGIFGLHNTNLHATPAQGWESLSLLVGMAILVLCVLWQVLRWQKAQQ
ncbi:hypothetical protein [Dictyobacter kobayashii]|uniref:Uncharacterized protein n=1 Tax=Dictyobacter kobayashii TaxID=2014872 RepID=A0A402AUU3_9CHLR|nr:hypothetical protein [Dictyobacter kobayashii]GCE22891.1 hypothetical protein KDK_66910 [Dictyobacter kobayashii]